MRLPSVFDYSCFIVDVAVVIVAVICVNSGVVGRNI